MGPPAKSPSPPAHPVCGGGPLIRSGGTAGQIARYLRWRAANLQKFYRGRRRHGVAAELPK